MARSVQAGVHGRTRRHIVAMGGVFAERFKSPGSDDLVSQDRFLALLARNGMITEEQLRRAIDSYRHDPHHYAWILRLRHTTLDKADKVFFVRYGRFPTKNDDFPVNGNYHQICQTLQCNPDCLDEEVRRLAWDVEGNPRIVAAPPKVLEAVQQVTSKKRNAPAFTLILLVSLASAIAFPLLITYAPMPNLLPAVLAVGIGWMMLLACGLIATRPRRFETSVVHHSCSECRRELDSVRPVDYCPHCGIRFEEQS